VNLLIIGGLLALALLAILGAVFLAVGETRAAANRDRPPNSPPVQVQEPDTEQTTRPIRQGIPIPAAGNTSLAEISDDARLPMLNGQFNEFAAELRALHQHARELEQRLSALTQILDRVEQQQDEAVDEAISSPAEGGP
jgi:hypothetical protein